MPEFVVKFVDRDLLQRWRELNVLNIKEAADGLPRGALRRSEIVTAKNKKEAEQKVEAMHSGCVAIVSDTRRLGN
jgi:hypothetical protein